MNQPINVLNVGTIRNGVLPALPTNNQAAGSAGALDRLPVVGSRCGRRNVGKRCRLILIVGFYLYLKMYCIECWYTDRWLGWMDWLISKFSIWFVMWFAQKNRGVNIFGESRKEDRDMTKHTLRPVENPVPVGKELSWIINEGIKHFTKGPLVTFIIHLYWCLGRTQ